MRDEAEKRKRLDMKLEKTKCIIWLAVRVSATTARMRRIEIR